MIANTCAGGVRRILIYILSKDISHEVQEKLLRSRIETLPDAGPDIEKVVISDLFLVIGPDLFFTFVFHLAVYQVVCVPLFAV